MALFNPKFGQRLSDLLAANGKTAFSAEEYVEYSVRHATIRAWTRGQIPTLEKFEKFLSYFPGEDINDWLDDMLPPRKAA